MRTKVAKRDKSAAGVSWDDQFMFIYEVNTEEMPDYLDSELQVRLYNENSLMKDQVVSHTTREKYEFNIN